MQQLLENHDLILMEAAVVEQCRRSEGVKLHPELVISPLIYDQAGRAALQAIFQSYVDIAREAQLPLLVCTPTWRADYSRVHNSKVSHSVNVDAARFMRQLCELPKNRAVITKIGGLLGCKHDCYQPEQGLPAVDAEQFHHWQTDQLVQGGVDFLIAETLPNVEEAVGIARALARSGLPYFLSFVISRDGRVLDGTSLSDAISRIDEQTDPPPLGYMVNCAYPTFLQAAAQPKDVFKRLVGYLANASALDQAELDEADLLHSEDIADWGERMLELNRCYGIHVLGGCCGTTHEHLRYLVRSRVQRKAW